ncbi:valine--tRNA ligase [Listeria sp. FSL L7-1509]|uniref:Valine--tRNA ligase n=1 Tax=Listeria immobilis TaxID=2713502 RepID=A0ABR6SV66_9LIST|nr:valine--tRNA ligase [Listeria immobilis]MBC1483470.1 valine--tRNA ligase [Listeria immobilis]MBC1506375.1 valine--tRNA ligase [Listeria immobilis]MBC1509340.1 valine--tRNA ligase [Listeria immobilis]MBC6303213.1 valine--tRNA ligase [Listeria immobilis]MBC6311714.1 valine--tRNA ligase [Listeria immobilis]
MTEQNEINMPTKYEPSNVEAGKYKWWIEKEFFKAEGNTEKKPYSVVIPPPNVTGKLHLGHAWDTTLQDIITRMKRMQGFDTLYLPGMDHAGIATQAKVEAKLKEENISRYDLGRENFIDKTWEWKEEYAAFIREQWEKLGLGLDYSRERFTLDDGLSEAVKKVFVKLYNKGLIYRGQYIINWDPEAKTALSDIEVIHKDIEGSFYHLKYPLTDGSGYLEVATTRPETIPGDTAVAVHPRDERYQHLIGKTIMLPVMNREIPIVADEYVEREFGSGAVKITPAHDPNDFEVGNRHDLPRIIVMHEDGTMNENAGKYDGLDRFIARKAIIQDFKDLGLFIKQEPHLHSVGHSERTGAVVEPYLSLQWFVKMEPLASEALALQKTEDKVNFVPARFEKTYETWMDNIHDWCISRQLWWGHRIPAWYHKETGEIYVGEKAPENISEWEQDEDVLDTWFSSALWPFSTMGWPDTENPDYKHFFPTNTLVTGYDIIFFWVSRMIFQSVEFTGERPFQDTLIHGLVRDSEGRKMSKSLGNGVDPIEVIDKYGADSLRYTLATGSSPGQDLKFSFEKVESTWNFINKIWNASRFVLMNLNDMKYSEIDLTNVTEVSDKWILTRLNETIQSVTALGEKYEFGEVGRTLYNFIWDDFCDWYIEIAKISLYGEDEVAKQTTRSVLAHSLNVTMQLLHPFMPFVTEEIWQNLPHEGESITISAWPKVNESQIDSKASTSMQMLVEVIRAVRNIRAEVNTPLSKKIVLEMKPKNDMYKEILEQNISYIERFCNPEQVTISFDITPSKTAMTAVVSGAEIFIPLEALIDLEVEIARLQKELEKWDKEVKRVQGKLNNERFISKAPESVVAEERIKEKDYLEKKASVLERIETLKEV